MALSSITDVARLARVSVGTVSRVLHRHPAVSSENLNLTRESYTAGNTGVLQILEAQRQSQQARLGLVRAQAQRLEDIIELQLALGGRMPAS